MSYIDEYDKLILNFQNRYWYFDSCVISSTKKKFDNCNSVRFDSSKETCLYPNDAFYVIYNNAFTIDLHICPDFVTGLQCIYDNRDSDESSEGFGLYLDEGFLKIYSNSTYQIIGTRPIIPEEYIHIRVEGNSSAVKLFIEGMQEGDTWVTDYNFTSAYPIFGVDYDNWELFFTGYMACVRISNCHRGFINFIPPEVPYEVDDNTTALLLFQEPDDSISSKDLSYYQLPFEFSFDECLHSNIQNNNTDFTNYKFGIASSKSTNGYYVAGARYSSDYHIGDDPFFVQTFVNYDLIPTVDGVYLVWGIIKDSDNHIALILYRYGDYIYLGPNCKIAGTTQIDILYDITPWFTPDSWHCITFSRKDDYFYWYFGEHLLGPLEKEITIPDLTPSSSWQLTLFLGGSSSSVFGYNTNHPSRNYDAFRFSIGTSRGTETSISIPTEEVIREYEIFPETDIQISSIFSGISSNFVLTQELAFEKIYLEFAFSMSDHIDYSIHYEIVKNILDDISTYFEIYPWNTYNFNNISLIFNVTNGDDNSDDISIKWIVIKSPQTRMTYIFQKLYCTMSELEPVVNDCVILDWNVNPNQIWYIALIGEDEYEDMQVFLYETLVDMYAGTNAVASGTVNSETFQVVLTDSLDVEMDYYYDDYSVHLTVTGILYGPVVRYFKIKPLTDISEINHSIYNNSLITLSRGEAELDLHTYAILGRELVLGIHVPELECGNIVELDSTRRNKIENSQVLSQTIVGTQSDDGESSLITTINVVNYVELLRQ